MAGLARFIETVDARIIAALALVVALSSLLIAVSSLLWNIRQKRQDRRRELQREEAQKKHTAKEREAFLAGFRELRFEPAPDGERRFVWDWPSTWIIDEKPDPRLMPWEDAFFLALSIWDQDGGWRPNQINQEAERRRGRDPSVRFVYETDHERTYRKRVLCQTVSGFPAYLALMPSGSESKPPVCLRHRRFLVVGGNCPDCGLSIAAVENQNPGVLEELRREWSTSTGLGV